MQISTRFTEYGITGAFFWICQLLLLTTPQRIHTLAEWARAWTPLFESIPNAFHALTVSLIGVLAITCVFIAGMLLDLFGSYFILWEISFYKRHLSQNREWLSVLLDAKAPHVGADFRLLEQQFTSFFARQAWVNSFSLFMPWSRKHRRRVVEESKQTFARFKLVPAYNRLLSFLISYVQVYSGVSQLEVLFDQVRLWRVGRAISTTLMLVFLEGLFVLAVTGPPEHDILYVTGLLVLLYATNLALGGLAMAMTLGAYSRLCLTLFSLAYMTFLKNDPGSVPRRAPIVLHSSR